MIIEIKELENQKETVVNIICKTINKDILKLEQHIKLFSKTILVKSDGDMIQVSVNDIYYIETIDRKTFVYKENDVFETDFCLYELEDRLQDCDFIRVSKSIILNLQKVNNLSPEINRTMLATMNNSEKIYISRQYARILKKILMNTNSNKGVKK